MSRSVTHTDPPRGRITTLTRWLAALLILSAGLNVFALVRYAQFDSAAKAATETANNAQWRLDVICANVPTVCKHHP